MMNNSWPAFQRYVPLACWLAVLLVTLLICLKIIAYGYLPAGDARRHAAKPFAHKPYSEIIVMRPEYVVDHSPGWEWLLGVLHKELGWSEDALISFSIASLLIWFFCLPLFWMRRPEAWLAAILAQMIAVPELMNRLTQARPFLLTDGLLIAFLLAWKDEEKNPRWSKVLLTAAGFALSAWMHGAWYLWVLLPVAFCLAQRWRAALWLAGAWVIGTLAGAILTGKPLAFLYEALFTAATVYQEHLPKWMLVGEFQSSAGEFGSLLVLALVWLWRKTRNKNLRPLFSQPVFWMITISWILGFFADRFWADWGMPALLVWVALQFDDAMPEISPVDSLKRLTICGLIVLPLYLCATSDYGRRYSSSLNEYFVNANDPDLKGWMPGKNGIFYADNMQFFYNTFYKNPQGDWRYIVGFEPALMPSEDLKIYRAIHRSNGVDETYQPWIKKMRPEDRLVVARAFQPALPALEWKHAGDVWIGRLPVSVHIR